MDAITRQALGLRARIIARLQRGMGPAGKGMLTLGTAADLLNIATRQRLAAGGELSPEEKEKLQIENAIAWTAVAMDLGGEALEWVSTKLGLQGLPAAPKGNVAGTVSRTQSMSSLGASTTRGIAALSTAGSALLSLVGTGFSWYSVHSLHTALQEAQASRSTISAVEKQELEARIEQLRVNLGISIATAGLGTILATGGTAAAVAGIGSALGFSGAALSALGPAAASFMAVAGPVGGALLMAAFVGAWVYNGVMTVQEFSRYLELSGEDKFMLGFGSLFGLVPENLQIEYDYQKLREYLRQAVLLETAATFQAMPAVSEVHRRPDIAVQGRVPHDATDSHSLESMKDFWQLFGEAFVKYEYPATPPQALTRAIYVDMDAGIWATVNPQDNRREAMDKAEFVYTRATRRRVMSSPVAYDPYTYGSLIDSKNAVIHLEKRPWNRHRALTLIGNFSETVEERSKGSQADTPGHKRSADPSKTVRKIIREKEAAPQQRKDELIRLNVRTHAQGGKKLRLEIHDTSGVLRSIETRAMPVYGSAVLRHAQKIRLNSDSHDDLLVFFDDQLIGLQGGKVFRGVTFSGTGKLLSLLPHAEVMAVNEKAYLTVFALDLWDRSVSLFRYKEDARGNYRLVAEFRQETQASGMPKYALTLGTWFHDINQDGLADWVTISKKGRAQVALQKMNGLFKATDDYDFYRTKKAGSDEEESLSFVGHRLLGFNGTARTLFSIDSQGNLYEYTLVSKAEKARRLAWVALDSEVNELSPDSLIAPRSGALCDTFIASSDEAAGDFIFRLGGGMRKEVQGGMGRDIFQQLDSWTFSTLDGREGQDTLDFSQMNRKLDDGINQEANKKTAADKNTGIEVSLEQGRAALKLKKSDSQSRPLMTFSNMENVTGTDFSDELSGDEHDNLLDGVKGQDAIRGVGGNDILAGTGGRFEGGAGVDTYVVRRSPQASALDIVEDPALGEASTVSLDYRLDEITGIVRRAASADLECIFSTGSRLRLVNFYAELSAAAQKPAPSYHFTTEDGFRFSLVQGTRPGEKIRVTYHPSFADEEERRDTEVNLTASNAGSDIVRVTRTRLGVRMPEEIRVPRFFQLDLSAMTAGTLTGSAEDEVLTGRAGNLLIGGSGADTYRIMDSTDSIDSGKRIVNIDNADSQESPATDTMELPWNSRETALSMSPPGSVNPDGHLYFSHATEPERHARVRMLNFRESRHLSLQGEGGRQYMLEKTRLPALLTWPVAL